MITLRCTQKLIKRMRLTPRDMVSTPPEATTVLGDWYANVLLTSPANVVLCVSERSRLAVVVPAIQMRAHLPDRFRAAVRQVLHDIGVSQRDIDREMIKMVAIGFAPASGTPLSRSMLATMNDFAKALKHDVLRYQTNLGERSRILSCTPCGPLNMDSPDVVTRRLFANGGINDRPLVQQNTLDLGL